MSTSPKLTLGIIVPVYNEEQGIEGFHRELSAAVFPLAVTARIYYVNDGSTDQTEAILGRIAERDLRVTVINLTRNFGHQAALSAGLEQAPGEVLVTMDGDGQHPPELIPEMLRLFHAGYDVVLGQRNDARQTTPAKRYGSGAFYWLLSRIGNTRMHPGVADYRLISRAVVDALKQMPEYHRFLRGMVAWLGFRTVILPYAEKGRRAGKSKYSFRKMMTVAANAVSSFSLVPLRIGIALGLGFLVIALLEIGYVLRVWIRGDRHLLVPGWSSLMFAVLLVGGIVMILLGLIGSYVGYIFQEVKRRPVYVVRRPRQVTPVSVAPGKQEDDSR